MLAPYLDLPFTIESFKMELFKIFLLLPEEFFFEAIYFHIFWNFSSSVQKENVNVST